MITKFKLFESKDQDIRDICKKYKIKNYFINSDMSISVNGLVNLHNKHLEKLPLKFKEVSDDFYCSYNQLTNLEGCPEKVSGGFYCSGNQLTSLEGCPDARDIHCVNNKITSFEGIPEFWEGELNIINNPVDEIFQLFNRDTRCIDLINEFDVIQGNKVSRDRLEEVFSHLDMEIPKNIKLINYKLI